MPSERASASPPWEEFFASREGTSRSVREVTTSHTSSWEVRQEGGLSSPWSSERLRDATPASMNLEERFFSNGIRGSPSPTSHHSDSSTWTSSIAHLLRGDQDAGRPTSPPAPPATVEYQASPGAEWGSGGNTSRERADSPPTARELEFDTAYVSQPAIADSAISSASYSRTQNSHNATATSFCSLLSSASAPQGAASSLDVTPEVPVRRQHAVDPSPLDAGGQYLLPAPSGGAAKWQDTTRASASSEIVSVQPLPATARYDSPLEAEAAARWMARQADEKQQAQATAVAHQAPMDTLSAASPESHSVKSIESRIAELAADDDLERQAARAVVTQQGLQGSQDSLLSLASAAVDRLAVAPEVQSWLQQMPRSVAPEVQSWLQQMPASVAASPGNNESLATEHSVAFSAPSSPIGASFLTATAPSARSSETGSSVGRSPLEVLGSLFSSPSRGEQPGSDEELGATLKAWTTSKKGSRSRYLDASMDSLNTTSNSSAASLAALQEAVTKSRQSKATAAASRWSATHAVKAPPGSAVSPRNEGGQVGHTGKPTAQYTPIGEAKHTPAPATALWQPAPARRGGVTPPRYDLDESMADDMGAWGTDVDQEYFVAQLANHIARKLHMRMSKTPPRPASEASGVETPGTPGSADWGQPTTALRSRLLSMATKGGAWGDDGDDSSVNVFIDVTDAKQRKKTKTKGKAGRRTTRSKKAATTRKAAAGRSRADDGASGDSKYSMTCSPSKRETFTRWVFGRELVAYKAVAAAVTPAGDTIYVSLYDGTTCYRIGEERLNSARGWFVYLDAEDAAEQPVPSKCKSVVDRFPRLILKVLVSGRGYQQGRSYAFPVMRPVAVMYPDDVVGKYCSSVPDLDSALHNCDKSNVLQTLRQLANTAGGA